MPKAGKIPFLLFWLDLKSIYWAQKEDNPKNAHDIKEGKST